MAVSPIPRWAVQVTHVLLPVWLIIFLYIDNVVVKTVASWVWGIWLLSCLTSTVRESGERTFSWRWPFLHRVQEESSPDSSSGPLDDPIAKG